MRWAAPLAFLSLASATDIDANVTSLLVTTHPTPDESLTLRLDLAASRKRCDPFALTINGTTALAPPGDHVSVSIVTADFVELEVKLHSQCHPYSEALHLSVDVAVELHPGGPTHAFRVSIDNTVPTISEIVVPCPLCYTPGLIDFVVIESAAMDLARLKDVSDILEELRYSLSKVEDTAERDEVASSLRSYEEEYCVILGRAQVDSGASHWGDRALCGLPNSPIHNIGGETQKPLSLTYSAAVLEVLPSDAHEILANTFVTSLLLALLAFLFISIAFYLTRRSTPTDPSRWTRFLERRAREKQRRRALRALLGTLFSRQVYQDFAWGVFCRLFASGEEDKEARAWRREAAARREQAEPEMAEQDTMEQELAQFRAAASMVDSLVAAEEGRSRAAAVSTYRPAPVEQSDEKEDSPPDYETDEEGDAGAFVADGFRYSPGEGSPVASTVGMSGSDALGYNK